MKRKQKILEKSVDSIGPKLKVRITTGVYMKANNQMSLIYNRILKCGKMALVLGVTFQFALACQSAKTQKQEGALDSNTATAQETSSSSRVYSWPLLMQQLTQNLLDLLPALTDPTIKGAEKKIFQSKIAELKRIAQNINEHTIAPDQDPSLKLIGKRFEDNLKLSLESFETGHTEFARTTFKSALAQCFQCHTRTNVGPALAQPQFINSLQKVAIVEKVQFLIASRYFDDAMKEITVAVKDGSQLSIVEWQKLVQMGLIINVRYQNDAKNTQQFLKLLSQNKNLPLFIKRPLPFWQKSVEDWNRKIKPSVNLATAEQMVKQADLFQKDSRGEGGTVEYLRAASLLHQFLTKDQTPAIKAEALLQLGFIYENIGEIGAWSMNEDYYELCIRTSPHTEISKKCFEKFQASTVSGFSGTGGVNIPEDVKRRITELKTIAL